MCWADRCCFFVKIDLGCVLIGITSFLFSTIMTVTSAVYLTMGHEIPLSDPKPMTPLMHLSKMPPNQILTKILTIKITLPTLRIILCSILVIGLMMMMVSVLLLIGVRKRKPGFILSYFGFGIFFTIFCKLGALLLLLQQYWAESMTIFLMCFLYIHFLVVVHTVYDSMVKRKMAGCTSFERLIEEEFQPEQTDIVHI